MFTNLGYFFAEAWRDAKNRPVAVIFSLVSITLLLLFAAFVFAGGEEVQWLVGQLGEETAVTVFLKEDVTGEQVAVLEEKLAALEGVTAIRFVSQEEALEEMNKVLGSHSAELAALAGFNPFLSYFEVGVRPEQGLAVARQAENLPGVDGVRDSRQTMERLTRLSTVLRLGALFTLIFVGVVMMITISHIVHLGLLAREEEMEIYRLLGAGPWFAVMPFLLQGSLLGLAGGMLAFLLSLLFFPLLFSRLLAALPFLPLRPGVEVALAVGPVLVVTGLLFGLCGSLLAQSHANH
ncbi:MAG TPA: hypothetical protein GX518_05155 [Firmicutes bacterium]|nr:hypothetical protein [Bacillota bacterium]